MTASRPRELEHDLIVKECLGVAVTAVRELAAPDSTSFSLRRFAFDLADGRTLDVFLKSFDVSPHTSDVARQRGMRERYVYEKILAGRELGTPELYGVIWDDPSGRHWLLLEFVPGRKLRRHPIEDRIAAAGWLARLQGSIAGHQTELVRSGLLLSYDRAYFLATAQRALQAVDSRSSTLRQRAAAVVAGYEAVIETVCTAQPTLVHGSYRALNILVDERSTPPRICPADWEHAAIGPPLHDLAFIADGFDRPTIERLCAAYGSEAAACGLAATRTDQMLDQLERLRLHKVLRSLARSAEWAYSDRAVTKLVTMAETIRQGVG